MNEKDIKRIIKQQLIPTGNVCLRKKIIVKEQTKEFSNNIKFNYTCVTELSSDRT